MFGATTTVVRRSLADRPQAARIATALWRARSLAACSATTLAPNVDHLLT